MANDYTRVLDTITPEVFDAYVENRTIEKSAIIQSGVAVADARVSQMISAGGYTVTMPFWNDLGGDDEVLGDGDKELGTDKMTAGADMANVLYRGKGWAVNEMAAILSGSDPVRSLLSKVSDWWIRDEQRIFIHTLNGLFADGAPLRKDHLNVTGAAIDPSAVLDTKQLLGDHSDGLAMIVMHSAVYTDLQKQQLIDYYQPAQTNVQIPTYLGYRVVVDDALKPTAGGTYTTYLLAAGSFGRNAGNPSAMTTFETDRNKAAGTDIFYTRRAFVMHPYGIKWTDSDRDAGNQTATNADLEKAANWQAVYDLKNIGIVGLQHTIAGPKA